MNLPRHPKPSSNADRSLIARLRVEHFKSLHDVDISLGSVNVLIGANGSGKSNVLEALGLLGAAAAGRIDDQALLRRGVRPGVPELYKSAFKKTQLAQTIHLEATSSNGASYSAHVTNPIKEPKPWWVFQQEMLKEETRRLASRSPRGQVTVDKQQFTLENHTSVASIARVTPELSQQARGFLDDLQDFAIFAPVTPVLRGIAPDTAPRAPVGLFGGQLPEAVGWLLRSQDKRKAKVFMAKTLRYLDWVQDFDVGPPSRSFLSPSVSSMRLVMRLKDRFMTEKRNVLSGYDASEGALFVLFTLVLALHPEAPRMLAIDNFDQGLHPHLARALASSFTDAVLSSGRQAVLTTHNPLVLDGLPLDNPDVRLFTVSRAKNGMTRVKPVAVNDLRGLKKRHGDDAVSRLWITGRLGGTPDGF